MLRVKANESQRKLKLKLAPSILFVLSICPKLTLTRSCIASSASEACVFPSPEAPRCDGETFSKRSEFEDTLALEKESLPRDDKGSSS